MPRRKRGGSRGPSPDKSFSEGGGALGPTSFNNGGQTTPPWSTTTDDTPQQQSKEEMFHNLQEMFSGKVEGNVVHMILEECDWKVDEAVEKLKFINPESDGEKDHLAAHSLFNAGTNMQQAHPISIPGRMNTAASRRSRLPTGPTEDPMDQSITMLSPKTPSMVGAPSFPEMFHNHPSHNQDFSQHNVDFGMEAIDSYANAPQQMNPYTTQASYDPNMYKAMFDMAGGGQHQQTQSTIANNYNLPPPNLNSPQPPISYANTSYASQRDPRGLSPNVPISSWPQPSTATSIPPDYSMPPPPVYTSSNSMNTPQQHPQISQPSQSPDADNTQPIPGLPYIKRGTRKKTLSLNPEEREALENLIEDVIIGGVDEGVIDSEDTTSSESEDEKRPASKPSPKVDQHGQRPSGFPPQQQRSGNSSMAGKNRDMQQSKPLPNNGVPSASGSMSKLKPAKAREISLNKEAQKVLAAASADPQQKVYPPQLKVAVKHMKNLPPRFLRKLQSAPKDDPGSSGSSSGKSDNDTSSRNPVSPQTEPQMANRTKTEKEKQNEQEKKTVEMQDPNVNLPRVQRTKEEQKLGKKKRIRGMLEGLDSYMEESEKKGDDEQGNGGAGDCASNTVENSKSPNLSPLAANSGLYVSSSDMGPPVSGAADRGIANKGSVGDMALFQRLQQLALSGGGNQPPLSSIQHLQSSAMNCEELERELLQDNTPRMPQNHQQQQRNDNNNVQQMQQQQQQQQPQQQLPQQGQYNSGMFNVQQQQYNAPLSPQQQQQQQQARLYGQQQQQQQNLGFSQQQQQQQHYLQQQYGQQQQQMKSGSQFSVDAPEFVPRSFTPGSLQQALEQQQQQQQQQLASSIPPYMQAALRNQQSHLDPMLFGAQQSQGRNSPAPTFLIPKMHSTPPPPSALMQQQQQQPSAQQQQQQFQQQQQQQQQFQFVQAVAAAAATAYPPGAGNTTFPPPFNQPPPPPPPSVSVNQQYQAAVAMSTMSTPPFLVHPWSGGSSPPAAYHRPQVSTTLQPPVRETTTSGSLGGPRLPHTTLSPSLHHLSAAASSTKPIMSPKMAKRGQHELSAQKAHDRIKSLVNGGKRVLVLLRGLPGAGKSTLAREIQFNGLILSTDDFFMSNGVYKYEVSKLQEAHEWNQRRAAQELSKQTNPVIIDNTNTQSWEMKHYVLLALKYDYHVEIIEPDTAWKFSPRELAMRNSHGVPMERIQLMLKRYDRNLTIERIMAATAYRPLTQHHQQRQLHQQHQQQQMQQIQLQDSPQDKSGRRKKRRRRKKERDTQKESKDENPNALSTDEDEDVMDAENSAAAAASSIIKLKSNIRIASRNGLFLEGVSSAASQPNSSKEHSEADSEVASETEEEKEKEKKANVREIAETLMQNSMDEALKVVLSKVQEKKEGVVDVDGAVEDKANDADSEQKEQNAELDVINANKDTEQMQQKTENQDSTKIEVKTDVVAVKASTEAQKDTAEDAVKPNAEAQKPKADKDDDLLMHPDTIINSEISTPLTSSTPRLGPSQLNSDDEDYVNSGGRPSLVAPPSSSTQSGGGVQPSSPRGEGGDGGGEMFRAEVQNNMNTLIEKMSHSIPGLMVLHEEDRSEVDGGVEIATEGESTEYQTETEVEKLVDETIPQNTELGEKEKPTEEEEVTKRDSSDDEGQVLKVNDNDNLDNEEVTLVAIAEKLVQSAITHAILSFQQASESSAEETEKETQFNSNNANTTENDVNENTTENDANENTTENDANENQTANEKTTENSTENLTENLTENDANANENHTKASQSRASVIEREYWKKTDDDPQDPQDSWSTSSLSEAPATPPVMQLDPMLSVLGPKSQREPREVRRSEPDEMEMVWNLSDSSSASPSPARGKQQRKRGKKAVDPTLSPALSPALGRTAEKEKLRQRASALPSFSERQMRPLASLRNIIPTQVAQTQTAVEDFVYLDRLSAGFWDEGSNGKVVAGNSWRFIPRGFAPKKRAGYLEKSSMTDAPFEEKVEAHDENFTQLKACFPTINDSALRDILERCDGDMEWATNILLDSGSNLDADYNLNVTSDNLNAVNNNEEVTDNQEAPEQMPPLIKPPDNIDTSPIPWTDVVNNVKAPPPLIELCHKALGNAGETPESVQLDVVKSSINRMHSIEDYKRQHRSEKPSNSPTTLNQFYLPPINLTLNLPSDFVQQLIDKFGPVGVHTSVDTLAMKDLKITLDAETARAIHTSLAGSVEQRFQSEEKTMQRIMDVRQDEDFARRLQAEEEEKSPAPTKKFVPVSSLPAPSIPPPTESLREIMDTELAIERSKKEYNQKEVTEDMSARMKRKVLEEKFPTVDTTLINEVFVSHGNHLGKTIDSLNIMMSTSPVQSVMTDDYQKQLEDKQLQEAMAESLRQQQSQWSEASAADSSSGTEASPAPGYAEYRAEANLHYRLRQECFHKAQRAHQCRQTGIAQFYSQQGHLHTQKMKEANERAAAMIVQFKNEHTEGNKLDLHGLHVDEALVALDSFLSDKKTEGEKCVFVVTGRGRHSARGVSKLKPAVISHLRKHEYRFTEPNLGMIKVCLG